MCIDVFDKDREKKKKRERERLWWFMTSCLGVCVSKREGPPVVCLRHSVHQRRRRSVLFVLLHPSVSDGSLMVMARRAVTAGADATLGWGRPSSTSSSSAPWGVLHATLVVTVHADLWEKENEYSLVPRFTATGGGNVIKRWWTGSSRTLGPLNLFKKLPSLTFSEECDIAVEKSSGQTWHAGQNTAALCEI